MNQVLRRISTLFHPDDEGLSRETKSQIQLYRLLSLLGAVLIPSFGLLYTSYTPLAVDPAWARFGIAGLFAGFLVASYWIEWVRHTYVLWVRGLIYVLMGWTVLLAYVNHFAGDFVASLLLVYATMIVVVGIGARTIRPVLTFAGIGFLAAAVLSSLALAPYTSPFVLIASMGTVAVVEGIAIYAYLSIRDQLRERERRLLGLTNSLPGVVFQFVAHPDGTYTNNFVSGHAESLLGLSPDPEEFYERFVEHVPESHREKLVESIDIAVEMEEQWRFEMPFERADGERLWLLGASTPEKRKDALVFNGVLYDITERREAEKAVRDREQKTEALYSTAQQLLAVRSSEEVASRVGDMLRRTFGYERTSVYFAREGALEPVQVSPGPAEDMPEASALDFDGDSIPAKVYRSGETTVTDDLQDAKVFGDEGLRSAACVPIGDRGVVSIVSSEVGGIAPFDVRLVEILAAYAAAVLDRLGRENQLVSAKEEAEEASQLKTAMLANMSHEIRTPLTSIVGFAEVLKQDLNGRHYEAADKIFRGGQRLLDTLDSVLRLSSLEAGAAELAQEPVCLDRVVEEAVEFCQPEAEENSLTLTAEPPDAPVEGFWDEAAVKCIAKNLLENAIKFTPKDGRIDIRVWDEDSIAVMEVEDTGIGMPIDQVPTLFQPFKQESEGLDRAYEGTGLGLSIVERLVEVLGGSISVETEKGAGSCFTVRLPIREPTSST